MAKVNYSFKRWCEDNGHQDWLELWDYKLNDVGPDEVAAKSNKLFWFMCPRGLHESEAKTLSNLASGRTHVFCKKGRSFGQWMLDNCGDDAFEQYYSDRNTVDWYSVFAHSSKKAIWVKCTNHAHPAYLTEPCHFVDGCRCPVCAK